MNATEDPCRAREDCPAPVLVRAYPRDIPGAVPLCRGHHGMLRDDLAASGYIVMPRSPSGALLVKLTGMT